MEESLVGKDKKTIATIDNFVRSAVRKNGSTRILISPNCGGGALKMLCSCCDLP
jgi:hypothetical protein